MSPEDALVLGIHGGSLRCILLQPDVLCILPRVHRAQLTQADVLPVLLPTSPRKVNRPWYSCCIEVHSSGIIHMHHLAFATTCSSTARECYQHQAHAY